MARDFKDKVREQFGRTAEGYVRNRGFASGEDLAEAARLLKPTTEDSLLDVACGGGHTALYFAPLVRSVVASDLTMQMLKRAQEYISEEGGVENVTFREADAEDLPFPAGAFTLLTCRIAPHHFASLSLSPFSPHSEPDALSPSPLDGSGADRCAHEPVYAGRGDYACSLSQRVRARLGTGERADHKTTLTLTLSQRERGRIRAVQKLSTPEPLDDGTEGESG